MATTTTTTTMNYTSAIATAVSAVSSEMTDGIVILSADPYLQYQPKFAYTLPIQLLASGITLTLLVVLLVHILFTTQYHYPLAPLNYALQLSSILVVLLSVSIKIVVILQHCANKGDNWPYDLDYIAVTIPGDSWSTGIKVAWLLLQALNNGLSNISHIQFLTLLYPSRVEARLIIFILGPLAIASSGLVFTALSSAQTVLDISDAIRNVFNSTLLLIFTISLVIWGFFVNRRRAWRWDGGTAVFGVGSLALALVSTSFNFVAVAEDGIEWLQHLLFAAVLWQVWLGWWWWVGSGMGIGEVEDIMERAERKKRKAAKAASRARASAAAAAVTTGGPDGVGNGTMRTRQRSSSLVGIATGVTSILRSRSGTGTLSRRLTRNRDDEEHAVTEPMGIEMDDLDRDRDRVGGGGLGESSSSGSGNGNGQSPRVGFTASPTNAGTEREGSSGSRNGTVLPLSTNTNSETSSTSATPSIHRPKSFSQLVSLPTTLLLVYLRRLRKAHEEAAKVQALERAEKRQKVFTATITTATNNPTDSTRMRARTRAEIQGTGNEAEIGWGLGRFGIREHEESAKRLRTADERLAEDRLLSNPKPDPNPDDDREQEQEQGIQEQEGGGGDNEWEDIDSSNSSDPPITRNNMNTRDQDTQAAAAARPDKEKGGWSWFGPLREWRLADRSTF